MRTPCALPASSGVSARHRAVDRRDFVLYDLISRLRAAEARQAHNLKVVSSILAGATENTVRAKNAADALQQGDDIRTSSAGALQEFRL